MSLPRGITAEQLELAKQLRAEQSAAGSFHSKRQGSVPRRGRRSRKGGPATRGWGTPSFQQGRATSTAPRSSLSPFNTPNGRSCSTSSYHMSSQPSREPVKFGGNISTLPPRRFGNFSSAGLRSSSSPIRPQTAIATQENGVPITSLNSLEVDRAFHNGITQKQSGPIHQSSTPDYRSSLLDADIDTGFMAPILIPVPVKPPGNAQGLRTSIWFEAAGPTQLYVPILDSSDVSMSDSVPAQAESPVRATSIVRPAQGLLPSRWAI